MKISLMKIVYHISTDGFLTKPKMIVNKLVIAVAHKKVLLHNKNVKNANADSERQKKRTTNTEIQKIKSFF